MNKSDDINKKCDWLPYNPENWEYRRIASIFKERNETVSEYDYEPLSVTKKGILKQLESAAKTKNVDNKKKVCKGDFVINSRSDRKGSGGISPYDGSVSVISIVLEKGDFYEEKYLNYLLTCKFFQEEFYKKGRGIVADLWSTRFQDMKTIVLPIPPIDEQKKIAGFILAKSEKSDYFIKKKQELIKLLNEQKQSIIDHAVSKGIYENTKMKSSGIEWIGDIPEHWEVRKLKFLGQCQNGINKDSNYFGSGFPFLSYSDVYKNEFLPLNLNGLVQSTFDDRVNYSVMEGDVFFTRTSETIEEIGFSSTCTISIKDATFSGFLIRFRPFKGYLYKGFSKYYFRSQLHRYFFVKEMNLVTRASLSQDLLKNLPVVLPPLDEQEKIANYLDKEIEIYNLEIMKEEKEIELIKEYKESLIAEAVMGKIKI